MDIGYCAVSWRSFKQIDTGSGLWHRDHHQRDLFHLGVGRDSCLSYQIQENPSGLTCKLVFQGAVCAVYQLRRAGAVCRHSGDYAVCGCNAPGFAADAAVVYWIISYLSGEREKDRLNCFRRCTAMQYAVFCFDWKARIFVRNQAIMIV